ncbi:MAG TPA: hypothetical protein PK867_02670 [Pirellulales bacterium]|nr:hypothetical protein [Pirellulales bacterium]
MTAVFAINLLGAAAVSQFAEMPINVFGLFAPLCGVAAFLVLAVELERQRIRSGEWRFRFSLGAILWWTAIASAFFALAMSGFRENQRGFAVNQQLRTELEAVVNGGTITISMPWGRNITCEVTRASFSDDDLARIVELASQGGTRPCELSFLFLARTSITDAGVRRLAACEKLVFVELPSMKLSDEAIGSQAKCRRLEFLFLDERRLSAEQFNRLRTALPDVRLNGKTWAARHNSP